MQTDDYDPTGAKYRTPEPKKDRTGGLIVLAVVVLILGAAGVAWLVVNGG